MFARAAEPEQPAAHTEPPEAPAISPIAEAPLRPSPARAVARLAASPTVSAGDDPESRSFQSDLAARLMRNASSPMLGPNAGFAATAVTAAENLSMANRIVQTPLADDVIGTWGEGEELEADDEFIGSLPSLMSYSDPGSLISGAPGEGSPLGPRAQRAEASDVDPLQQMFERMSAGSDSSRPPVWLERAREQGGIEQPLTRAERVAQAGPTAPIRRWSESAAEAAASPAAAPAPVPSQPRQSPIQRTRRRRPRLRPRRAPRSPRRHHRCRPAAPAGSATPSST